MKAYYLLIAAVASIAAIAVGRQLQDQDPQVDEKDRQAEVESDSETEAWFI